ncbi:MAG: nucleoside deaminase [Thermonemataceae bacterium]
MKSHLLTHEYFMNIAYQQALIAGQNKEIPVGAVVVADGQLIAKTHNQTEQLKDVTAHAEILAITAATHFLGAKYLKKCTMYVTLEPCTMCAGALYWAQIGTLVYAADDPDRGFSSKAAPILHPKTKVVKGILAEPCQQLLQKFFKSLRN